MSKILTQQVGGRLPQLLRRLPFCCTEHWIVRPAPPIQISPQEDVVAGPVKLASTCQRRPPILSPSLQQVFVKALLHHRMKFLEEGGEAPKLNRRSLPKVLLLLHRIWNHLASSSPTPSLALRSMMSLLPLVPVSPMLQRRNFLLTRATLHAKLPMERPRRTLAIPLPLKGHKLVSTPCTGLRAH